VLPSILVEGIQSLVAVHLRAHRLELGDLVLQDLVALPVLLEDERVVAVGGDVRHAGLGVEPDHEVEADSSAYKDTRVRLCEWQKRREFEGGAHSGSSSGRPAALSWSKSSLRELGATTTVRHLGSKAMPTTVSLGSTEVAHRSFRLKNVKARSGVGSAQSVLLELAKKLTSLELFASFEKPEKKESGCGGHGFWLK
jgi:hypothetical protein